MSNAQRLQWQFPKNVSNGLIGWRSDGLGLENKLAAFNDVKQFGAEGDGVTDDTAAITAALARLTSGGVLFFPAGTYLISSTIDTLSNVTFAGAGMGASIILADAADFNMIEVQDGQSDIAFRDLTIKGAATADSTTQYGVIASASSEASRVTIERCRFTNSNNGISTGSGTGWRVNECYFDTLVGVISGTGYGVLVAGSSTRCHVTGCDYLGTSGNGRHAVYLSVNATYCRVVGNSVKDCNETAIVCRASTGQGGVHGNIIAGNNIEGGGTVSSDASAAILVAGIATWNEVYGNFVEDFANDGIVVSNLSEAGTCQFNSVADNTVVECDLRGIDIRGTKSTRVSGNRVYNCSQASSGTHAGLRIVEDTATNEVCDLTRVFGNEVSGTGHRVAFQISGSSPISTNTLLGPNLFLAGATAGKAIELNGATVKMIGQLTDGRYTYGSDDVNREICRRASVNFGSISATSTGSQTVTVAGVATAAGWSVHASPEVALDAGLVFVTATVTGTDTVTIYLYNTTGSPIDPAAQVWNVICRKLNS